MARKYTFTNIHTGAIYIPETSKVLAPGESMEYIGDLEERTPTLHEKRLLNIEDNGAASSEDQLPKIEKIKLTEDEQARVEAANKKEEPKKEEPAKKEEPKKQAPKAVAKPKAAAPGKGK